MTSNLDLRGSGRTQGWGVLVCRKGGVPCQPISLLDDAPFAISPRRVPGPAAFVVEEMAHRHLFEIRVEE